MVGPSLSESHLHQLLHEQVDFIRTSSARFDEGNSAEAKRLAVCVRVLVHNTRKSHALLKQLGLLHQLEYLDTSTPMRPDRHVPPRDGRPGKFRVTVGSGLAPLEAAEDGASYVAPLGDAAPHARLTRFSKWWTDEVARAAGGRKLTRKKIVLGLANLEGGAHVDPFPDLQWADMSTGGAFGTAGPVHDDDGVVRVSVSIPIGWKSVERSRSVEGPYLTRFP